MWDEDDALEWLEELEETNRVQTKAVGDEIKFDLYLRSREFKQLSEQLQSVLLFSKSERQAWIKENQEVLNDLLKEYLSETLQSLHGLELDAEGRELSVELVTNMRDTMSIVHNMIGHSDTKL